MKNDSIKSRQIRAARTLLDWSQEDLAKACYLSITTIRKLEMGYISRNKTIELVRHALEDAGLEFIEPGGVRRRNEDITIYHGTDDITSFYDDMYQTSKKKGGDASLAYDPSVVANETLVGNADSNTYQFGANFRDTVINNAVSGSTAPEGEVQFLSGITTNELWFQRVGNNLQVDLLGTTNEITISGWYGSNASAQVQGFETADGSKLDSQIAQLVSAMATYSASNSGFNVSTTSTMPTNSALQTALAASWHH